MAVQATQGQAIALIDEINEYMLQRQAVIANHTNEEAWSTLYEKLDRLTSINYEEERIEQILKTLVEKARAELAELIRKEADFTSEHERAAALLTSIKNRYYTRRHHTSMDAREQRQLSDDLFALRSLLTAEVQTTQALHRISELIAQLMDQAKRQ